VIGLGVATTDVKIDMDIVACMQGIRPNRSYVGEPGVQLISDCERVRKLDEVWEGKSTLEALAKSYLSV
jgi:hypothetical protein